MDKDEYYMRLALQEARLAYEENEVPIGCVIVSGDEVLVSTHNKRVANNDIFSHAEILALKEASLKLNTWILDNLTLYVTVEPCAMCASSILASRIKRVVYGTSEPKFGSFGSVINLNDCKFNHHVELVSGVLKEESEELMKDFFQNLRIKKSK